MDDSLGCYPIEDIRYAIQWEANHFGSASVFVQFGRDSDRCERPPLGVVADLIQRHHGPELGEHIPTIVCVGDAAEQVDEAFVKHFTDLGYRVSMETDGSWWNGAMPLLYSMAVSPKSIDGWWSKWWKVTNPLFLATRVCLKVELDPSNPNMGNILKAAGGMPSAAKFIKPSKDPGTGKWNMGSAAQYVMDHPQWRFSFTPDRVLEIL